MQNVRLYAGLLLGSALAVWSASFMPALTSPTTVTEIELDEAVFEKAYSQELDYCRNESEEVNCRCFANVAGVVIASEQPRVPGARYPDRLDLARVQASDRC